MYAHVHKPEDLPEPLLQKMVHFFQHYKDLEANKWSKIVGWQNADAAKALIKTALAAYPG